MRGIAVVQDPADAAFPEMPQNALKAAKADYCVGLNDMGALLMQLTLTPVSDAKPISERLKKEVRISKGLIEPDIEENIMGAPVPFICPDCGGSLSEIAEGNIIRYRCHEGHAFTALSFLDAQWERIEYSLWSAVRVMEEQVNMLRKLANRHGAGETRIGTGYEERAAELQTHAGRLKDYLLYTREKAG